MYHRLRNHFGHTRRYHSVTRLKWKLISAFLDIVLILTQDRCTVGVKRTIGSEINLDGPDGRNMVCVERTIVSEIIFDAPDGTLM